MKNNATLLLGVVWLSVAIFLLVFTFFNRNIIVEWHTATEQNTAGFFVYRANSPDGTFELITDEYIPSEGNSISGGSYSYTDKTAVPGETYYYLLEEIENDGTVNQYTDEIISRRVPQIETWAIILVALVTLIGIGFIISGIREGR